MSLAHLRRLAGIGDPSAYRDVDEAIQPIGTVHSRKDGDWVKTADGWVRVKKKEKASIIGSKTPPMVSRPKKKAVIPASTPVATPVLPAPAPAPVAKPLPAAPAPKPAPAPTATPASAPASESPAQALTRKIETAHEIAPAVTAVMKKLGDDFDRAEVDEKNGIIYASFRRWDIPKDAPDEEEDGESEVEAYYDSVRSIAKAARDHLNTALAPHADKIEKSGISLGDKNWFEVYVKLK